MIEWESFLLVAVVSLVAASAVVTIASLGMKLYESALHARETQASSGRWGLLVARILFGLCGLLVLFGVYLIVPVFH
ncbi:MAG: hypothetical protein ABIW32_08150 [Terrimesophilobacter sp.]